jgi:CheY-like chemotaxis protein
MPRRLAPHRHAARLLLAEDNAINREVALELLHAVGLDGGRHRGDGARRWRRRVPHRAYDLILMDMQMPGHGRARSDAAPSAQGGPRPTEADLAGWETGRRRRSWR